MKFSLVVTQLVTVKQVTGGTSIHSPDCNILTNIIKVPYDQINTIVKDCWNTVGAQQRSSKGPSKEHAVIQFGILLMKNTDKELQ